MDVRIAVPPEHVEGVFSSGLSVEINGDAVSLLFWRDREWQDDPGNDAHAVVVAHVVIDRKRWDNLPAVLAAMRDGLRGESPDPPAS